MKYLLDTHVVLWVAGNSPLLSEKAKAVILDKSSEMYVSIVSAWEVAIKLGTSKLSLKGGLSEFFRMIDDNGFATLAVERDYLLQLQNLPDFHKDPFDRLIIATAAIEGMTMITNDENIQRYNTPWVW